MNAIQFDVGAYVLGEPTAPRALVRHTDLLNAYADAALDDDREAYLSHFAFGLEMRTHYAANRNSVAEYVGPCWARWLVLDIDRADLSCALEDTRTFSKAIIQRYPELETGLPIFFSGSKGFHIFVELTHNPPPAVGFNCVARTFAEALAACARVTIDSAIFDLNRIVRLPNTKHPRTGLFKRRIDFESLFMLDMPRILELAKHPAGDGIPTVCTLSPQLVADWADAERETAGKAVARAIVRRDAGTADTRAPRYFVDFLRFGVEAGERHGTLFRCAAWLTEQGAPPSLVCAMLTEPGRDVGLTPADVARQIACGIEHARRQRGPMADSPLGGAIYCQESQGRYCPPNYATKWGYGPNPPTWFEVSAHPIPITPTDDQGGPA